MTNLSDPPSANLGNLLDELSLDMNLDTELLDRAESEDSNLIPIVNLSEGEIDPRLKLLSHSSRLLLHSCPRKYQLYRLNSKEQEGDPKKEQESAVTFAYGKAVGIGIQSSLENKTEDQILMDTFLEWDTDLLENTPRQNKSFWLALFAVQRFMNKRSAGFLDDYELVYWKGQPAVELSFQIVLPGGYKYRGFIDAVLQHKGTREILVLEDKTTSGKANSAMYKNSGQALGYSVVLDKIAPEHSSYTVLYMIYETNSMEYVEMPFSKSLLQRALWLQELLVDTHIINLYNSYEVFPMHGQSCYSFYKECEYLGLCTLNTNKLTKPFTERELESIEEDNNKYTFNINYYDLVEAQLTKGAL